MSRLERWETEIEPDWQRFQPSAVAIETIAQCNRECGYCPVAHAPKRKGRMTEETVLGLIDQLAALDYTNRISFHYYNEPLLDKRLMKFTRYAGEKLPRATCLLTSNGDVLNEARVREYFENGVTDLAISAHDEETHVRFEGIRAGLPAALKQRLSIRPYYRVGDGTGAARITNRGGSVDMTAYAADEVTEASPEGCDRIQFNIDYEGNVHPCCMDFGNEYILGNAFEEKLYDIWLRARAQFREHYLGEYTKDVCFRCAKIAR
ncbi:MAG: radical SAM/SPASM domain-containing protein [Gammaproteobacteria bacterium]